MLDVNANQVFNLAQFRHGKSPNIKTKSVIWRRKFHLPVANFSGKSL